MKNRASRTSTAAADGVQSLALQRMLCLIITPQIHRRGALGASISTPTNRACPTRASLARRQVLAALVWIRRWFSGNFGSLPVGSELDEGFLGVRSLPLDGR
jgi:hypothetical protein